MDKMRRLHPKSEQKQNGLHLEKYTAELRKASTNNRVTVCQGGFKMLPKIPKKQRTRWANSSDCVLSNPKSIESVYVIFIAGFQCMFKVPC